MSIANTRFCFTCFEHFRSENMLELHNKICGKQTHLKVFPKEEETLYFKNREVCFKRIFVGYADFESVLKDTSNVLQCPECCSAVRSSDEYECPHSFTLNTKIHHAISVSFIIVDRYGELVHEFCYTGDDVIIQFVKNVLQCEDILVKTTKFNRYMIFNHEDNEQFNNATVCYICNNERDVKGKIEKPFNSSDPKVRDHDHLTGNFLGAAHNSCNLNKRREKPFLSIFMHNFSGYDSHLILPFLIKSKIPEIDTINVLPRSGEKFMSIQLNRRVTFLDSMNFLSGGLNALFESIKDTCRFKIIEQSSLMCEFKTGTKINNAKERLKYLLKKGSFPYEWAKSIEDYSLPHLVAKESFYNSITRSNISEKDYKTSREIWTVFEMKNMRDYMETYCMCDTLLLAEVFETFRNECLNNFDIDPGHFISLPGLAYQAFLKKTEVNLEYITNPDLFEMLSSNLRGGHSFASQRYEESSDLKEFISGNSSNAFDIRQHLLYIDANNL